MTTFDKTFGQITFGTSRHAERKESLIAFARKLFSVRPADPEQAARLIRKAELRAEARRNVDNLLR